MSARGLAPSTAGPGQHRRGPARDDSGPSAQRAARGAPPRVPNQGHGHPGQRPRPGRVAQRQEPPGCAVACSWLRQSPGLVVGGAAWQSWPRRQTVTSTGRALSRFFRPDVPGAWKNSRPERRDAKQRSEKRGTSRRPTLGGDRRCVGSCETTSSYKCVCVCVCREVQRRSSPIPLPASPSELVLPSSWPRSPQDAVHGGAPLPHEAAARRPAGVAVASAPAAPPAPRPSPSRPEFGLRGAEKALGGPPVCSAAFASARQLDGRRQPQDKRP